MKENTKTREEHLEDFEELCLKVLHVEGSLKSGFSYNYHVQKKADELSEWLTLKEIYTIIEKVKQQHERNIHGTNQR